MALTRNNIVAQVGIRLDIDTSPGSELETYVIQHANLACRRVWNEHNWHFRRKDALLSTYAPYVLGLVTATLGAATVTGASTSWPSTITGRKFSLGAGGAWYRATRDSTTQLTLERAFAEDDVSAHTYEIFQDEYDLGTDVVSVDGVYLIRDSNRAMMVQLTAKALDDSAYVTGAKGWPVAYAVVTDQTARTTRIRLYPIPDDVYGIRVQYHKSFTDFASGNAVTGMGDDLDEAVIEATCLLSQVLPTAAQVTNESMVKDKIDRVWAGTQKNQVLSVRRRGFDVPIPYLGDDVEIWPS